MVDGRARLCCQRCRYVRCIPHGLHYCTGGACPVPFAGDSLAPVDSAPGLSLVPSVDDHQGAAFAPETGAAAPLFDASPVRGRRIADDYRDEMRRMYAARIPQPRDPNQGALFPEAD